MDSLLTKAVLAGVCFGLYPLLLNKSGLSGYLAVTIFTFIVFAVLAPFSLSSWGQVSQANWKMLVSAGLVSGIGMLLLGKILAKATLETVPVAMMTITIVQIVTSAAADVMINKTFTLSKGAGFGLALLSVYLLCKK